MTTSTFRSPIRWGIIGCGDVCEVKSGPGFRLAQNSALVAVMRRDLAKAADYAARHGVPRWYDDAEKLIRDPEVAAEQSGGGIFLDIGSHVLDLLDHLLGEFVEYGGVAARALAKSGGATNVEDVVALHFVTSRGVVGDASWNFAASVSEERLEIDGTEGRLSMEVLGHSPLILSRSRRSGAGAGGGGSGGGGKPEVVTINLPDPPHIQQPLIQTVVNALLGRGDCPSTGHTAARTSA